MQPNVAVALLTMRVDPLDSSYMPTLVVISAGSSTDNLEELATVSIPSSQPNGDPATVVLLRDVSQVSFYMLLANYCRLFCCLGLRNMCLGHSICNVIAFDR